MRRLGYILAIESFLETQSSNQVDEITHMVCKGGEKAKEFTSVFKG